MRRTNHQLNPDFIRAIRLSPLLGSQLALRAGFSHHSRFSSLLHAAAVPDSTAPLFRRVAELVDFDPAHIFVAASFAEAPRLVKGVKRSPICEGAR